MPTAFDNNTPIDNLFRDASELDGHRQLDATARAITRTEELAQLTRDANKPIELSYLDDRFQLAEYEQIIEEDVDGPVTERYLQVNGTPTALPENTVSCTVDGYGPLTYSVKWSYTMIGVAVDVLNQRFFIDGLELLNTPAFNSYERGALQFGSTGQFSYGVDIEDPCNPTDGTLIIPKPVAIGTNHWCRNVGTTMSPLWVFSCPNPVKVICLDQ